MGGHESKQSASATTNIIASAVQSVSQSCTSYQNGDNKVVIDGNGNVVGNVTQTMAVVIDSTCAAQVTQDASFQNKISDSVAQALKDQEVALTEWMDNSKDDSETHVHENITTSVTSATVQKCLNSINDENIVIVTGERNVVGHIIQTETATLLSRCLLGDGQVSDTVNDVTNTINQHSEYTSENPLAFITDAIEAILKSFMMVAAIIFIVIICFVSIFAISRHGQKKTAPPPSPAFYGAPLGAYAQ
jgi:hypothetical protein